MKTRIVVYLVACSCSAALGQGVVQFRNYWMSTTPPIDAPVSLYPGGPRLNASNPLWRAALIGGPVGSIPTDPIGLVLGNLQMMYHPANTTLTWVNFRTGTTPPAADGYVNVGSSAARVVPGVNWGGVAVVQMVAWQGNFTTYADAWTAWQTDPGVLVGASNPLTLQLPSSSTSPVLTYLWGLQSFSIAIPEPGVGALARLGLMVLAIFRRRQARPTGQGKMGGLRP